MPYPDEYEDLSPDGLEDPWEEEDRIIELGRYLEERRANPARTLGDLIDSPAEDVPRPAPGRPVQTPTRSRRDVGEIEMVPPEPPPAPNEAPAPPSSVGAPTASPPVLTPPEGPEATEYTRPAKPGWLTGDVPPEEPLDSGNDEEMTYIAPSERHGDSSEKGANLAAPSTGPLPDEFAPEPEAARPSTTEREGDLASHPSNSFAGSRTVELGDWLSQISQAQEADRSQARRNYWAAAIGRLGGHSISPSDLYQPGYTESAIQRAQLQSQEQQRSNELQRWLAQQEMARERQAQQGSQFEQRLAETRRGNDVRAGLLEESLGIRDRQAQLAEAERAANSERAIRMQNRLRAIRDASPQGSRLRRAYSDEVIANMDPDEIEQLFAQTRGGTRVGGGGGGGGQAAANEAAARNAFVAQHMDRWQRQNPNATEEQYATEMERMTAIVAVAKPEQLASGEFAAVRQPEQSATGAGRRAEVAGGMEILPGVRSTLNLRPIEMSRAREQAGQDALYMGALQTVGSLIRDGVLTSPEGRARAEAVMAPLVAMVAEFKNIGIIQIGEMPATREALGDPTSIRQALLGMDEAAWRQWVMLLNKHIRGRISALGINGDSARTYLTGVRSGAFLGDE